MSIKNLAPKPRKSKRDPIQNYFDISKSAKYKGATPVIYRSGLELKFFRLFESVQDYLEWESEPALKIPYVFEDKTRQYNIDVRFIHKTHGEYIAEIKPFIQTQFPNNPESRNFRKDKQVFEQNHAKWTAAKAFAERNNLKFCILTERFFS